MPGDGVEAGIGDEHLVLVVHPDRVRRRELEIPVALQRAVWVERDDPPLARQNAPAAASGWYIAHADICLPSRITGDRRGHSFDLLLWPAFDDLELEPIYAEPSWHDPPKYRSRSILPHAVVDPDDAAAELGASGKRAHLNARATADCQHQSGPSADRQPRDGAGHESTQVVSG